MIQNCIRLLLSKSNSMITSRCFATAAERAAKASAREEFAVKKLPFLQVNEVNDALDELVKQGRVVNRYDVISWVHYLRKLNKHKHALKLYEWMDQRKNKLNNADRAVRIELLARTKGIEFAESYFNSLQDSAKTKRTYGALFNCYCREKLVEMALQLFQKMDELGFASNALNYNNLISLYSRVGQHSKVPLLVQEMDEKNVVPDVSTYSQLIKTYISLKDFEAVEKVLEKMIENKVKPNLFTYGSLSTAYVSSGFLDKATAILEKMEKFEDLKDWEDFEVIITLYAKTSNHTGVKRVWDSLKRKHPKPGNISYLVMLLSLRKLGDTEGLEKCFQEWESGCSCYDVRLSNIMLESYLKRDMLQEAYLLSESVRKSGAKPNLQTFNLFMKFYLKKGQTNSAMQYLEMGVSVLRSEKTTSWFPSEESANAFLKHYEVEKDVDGAEKFCDLMKAINRHDSGVYDSLLLTYIAAGKVEPRMRQRMREQGIAISSKTEKLLENVCPH